MRPTTQQILQALDEPDQLESLYRKDPSSFRDALDEASKTAPDSAVLRVWRARLEYRDDTVDASNRRMWHAVAIGVVIGALARIPTLWLEFDWYFPRLAPSLLIASLAAYFWMQDRDRSRLIAGLALIAVAVVYTSLLPDYPDSVVMALIHLPILFWAFLGFVFTGSAWRDADARIRFVRYNGDLLILGSLVGLGVFVFSGITVSLFEMVFTNSGEWYAQNVGILLAAAAPVAATYLYDVVFNRRTGIAPALARIFAPLFLVMTITYLAVAFLGGKNPFEDRSFLITVNGLLLMVLGMTVLAIAERGERDGVGWIDYVNVALLVVTLVIDVTALSAILFRLTSYGFTPNRVVVLGANLVIMVHLLWIGKAYLGLASSESGATEVRRAVVGYLPVYAGWAALVTFVLPLVFGYA
ncbi:MAG TPA: hypothetical protein VJB15_06080 [Rhodothermia bacterium]|nr:hypothetical protein [Rhodothermia bacterium]